GDFVATADAAPVEDDRMDDPATVWPREIAVEQGRIVVYQPQIDVYADGAIQAHAAIALSRTGDESDFGAAWFTADVRADRDAGECGLYRVAVTRVRLPDAPSLEESVAAAIRREAPEWAGRVSCDRLLPALAAAERARTDEDRLRNDAPRIVVATRPALL